MRALLVANPYATTTTRRVRSVLTHALGSELKLEVAETSRRGHGTTLARQAAEDGLDLVVVLGGDGTVNEAVNGLLARGPDPDAPALAVVPGGSANVFARALGASRDPVEATGEILEALRAGRSRRVGLGRMALGPADSRWFTFCAGLGLDAEVIRRMERYRRHGRQPSGPLYLRATVAQYFGGTDRRHPALTLHRPGQAPVEGLFNAIVANTQPWTYLGRRPVRACPDASFDTGLDVLAMRRLRLPSTLRTAYQMLASDTRPHGRRVLTLHDEADLQFSAAWPVAIQLDGEYLGEREQVRAYSVPDALRVIC